MWERSLLRFMFVLAIAFGFACSSNDDRDSTENWGSGEPIPLDAWPRATAAALCPALAGCCQQVGLPLSDAQCRTSMELFMTQTLSSADPANFSYDDAEAGRCIAAAAQAIGNSACSADLGTDVLCGNVFQGRLMPGSPCNAEVECAAMPGDDTSCEAGSDGTEVCFVERRANQAEPCYWTCTTETFGESCVSTLADKPFEQGQCFSNDGLFCSNDGVCAAQASIGQACSGSSSCVDGSHCDFSSGLCAAPALQGQSCSSNSGCAEGLYCRNQTCTPELEPGIMCEPFDSCRDGSCVDGTCSPSGNADNVGLALLCVVLALSSQQ